MVSPQPGVKVKTCVKQTLEMPSTTQSLTPLNFKSLPSVALGVVCGGTWPESDRASATGRDPPTPAHIHSSLANAICMELSHLNPHFVAQDLLLVSNSGPNKKSSSCTIAAPLRLTPEEKKSNASRLMRNEHPLYQPEVKIPLISGRTSPRTSSPRLLIDLMQTSSANMRPSCCAMGWDIVFVHGTRSCPKEALTTGIRVPAPPHTAAGMPCASPLRQKEKEFPPPCEG